MQMMSGMCRKWYGLEVQFIMELNYKHVPSQLIRAFCLGDRSVNLFLVIHRKSHFRVSEECCDFFKTVLVWCIYLSPDSNCIDIDY